MHQLSELEVEHLDVLVLEEVKRCEGVGTALFMVMQAIPCILHGENRVSITMLLIEAFSNAHACTILREYSATKKNSVNITLK